MSAVDDKTTSMPPASPCTEPSKLRRDSTAWEEHVMDNVWAIHGQKRWLPADDALWSWADTEDPWTDEEPEEAPRPSLIPEWQLSALCVGMPPSDFYGGEGTPESPSMTPTQRRNTKSICNRCPVQGDCLEFALTNREQYGIWGGTTDEERGILLKIYIDPGLLSIDKIVEDVVLGLKSKYEIE
jgi:WhiB family redox-sensing transcriptional regulator